MLDPNWVFLSLALSLTGAVRYATLTVRGLVRPNLVTWGLWAAAPLIGFFAQLDAGVGMPAIQTLGAGVSPLIVFIAGIFSQHARVRVTAFDVWCAVFSVVALGVWVGFGHAALAVWVAIAADAIAALPTYRKTWIDPASEGVFFFVLVVIGSTVTLATITSWTPETWGFAAYVLLNGLIIVAIALGRKPRAVTVRSES